MNKLYKLFLLLIFFACTDNIAEQDFKAKSDDVTIINDAKNTSWYINSSNITNIEPMTIDYNNTIVLNDVKKVDTIVLKGNILSNNIELFNGDMYVPFNNTIILSNCRDSANNKLIHQINFDADIKDWEF